MPDFTQHHSILVKRVMELKIGSKLVSDAPSSTYRPPAINWTKFDMVLAFVRFSSGRKGGGKLGQD